MALVPAERTRSEDLSNRSTVTAEERQDTIEPLPLENSASVRSAKDGDAVLVNQDPLELGKHRRDVTQKQMKEDYPLAKPKHMKVALFICATRCSGI